MPEPLARHRLRRLAASLLVVGVMLAGDASAVTIELRDFASAEKHELYRELIAELRCLVCQNQNLAESDAELAADLRTEVYRLLESGADRDEVVAFMVQRYGDFVLYRPPLRATTVLLWLGPFALAAGGLIVLVTHLRRRTRLAASTAPLSDTEREEVERLVEDVANDGKRGA